VPVGAALIVAEETTAVIKLIEAKGLVVSDPFMAAAPVLSGLGVRVATIEQLLDSPRIDPVETGEDDLAFMQLTSGSTGSPKAIRITHANLVANAEAMFAGANVDLDSDVIVSWLPCFMTWV
jgi:fatty-acyl-CoA synthase